MTEQTATATAPAVDPLESEIAKQAKALRIMQAVEYTDHQGVARPAVVTKIFPSATVNLVAYAVHAGDPPTDFVAGVMCNPRGGAPNRWRAYS